MMKIEKFINEMKQKYGDSVIVKERTCDEETLAQIPQPLKEFYSLYDSVEFPFGYIYPIKTTIKKREPFESEGWFCFGFDGYFSYWLCNCQPDADGLWITPWDHETDDEKECVYADLVEFLQDMEEEYE